MIDASEAGPIWSFIQLNPASQTSPDFAVSAQSSTLSVQPGFSVTDNITISSLYGFYGPVTATCSGAPALATCTLDVPAQMMLPTENLLPTLTITTTAPTSSSGTGAPLAPGGILTSRPLTPWMALFGLALWVLAAGYRRNPVPARAVLLAVGLVCLGGWSSCGGAPVQTQPPPGGGISHSTTITLTVQ